MGSAAEGAIVAGVSAIPGLGPAAAFVSSVAAGAVGAAVNSTVTQVIDNEDHQVNGLRVLEDGIVGGIAGGITHGIGSGIKALRGKSNKLTTTSDAYISNAKDLDSHADKLARIVAAGKNPSSLTRKVGDALNAETRITFKNFAKSAGAKIFRDSTKTVIYGFTNTWDLTQFLKRIISIDETEEDFSLSKYIETYFKNIGDMVNQIEICIEEGN